VYSLYVSIVPTTFFTVGSGTSDGIADFMDIVKSISTFVSSGDEGVADSRAVTYTKFATSLMVCTFGFADHLWVVAISPRTAGEGETRSLAVNDVPVCHLLAVAYLYLIYIFDLKEPQIHSTSPPLP